MPVPLQAPMSVTLPLVQRASAHLVPAAYWRQAPRPLQVPSFPQLCGPASLQVLAGSTPPAATGLQIPIELASLHCWQTPLQRLLQQTPPVQKPLPQTLSREQGAPSGSRPHSPSMQALGATQSLLLVQEVPQRLPAHLKEPQLRAA